MHDRLKEAFEAVHAEEALKEKTSQFLFQKTRGYETKRRPLRRFVPVMACCLLVLFLSVGTEWPISPLFPRSPAISIIPGSSA